jgi:hypothetical protein
LVKNTINLKIKNYGTKFFIEENETPAEEWNEKLKGV